MKRNTPIILLINPWIHDFAAYDFWAKPLGLLILASILRQHGLKIFYIDCLDRYHPNSLKKNDGYKYGQGKYFKINIRKPEGLEDIPRIFSRYGIKPEWLIADLKLVPKPDLIFITSMMTYWYTGLQETIEYIKKVFPDVPIILGGVYATLCNKHANDYSGADKVISGSGEEHILSIVEEYTGFKVKANFDPNDIDSYPVPAFDLQRKISYIPILTSRGCPFSCAYCASKILNPKFLRKSPKTVIEEIIYWHQKYNIIDFAFYDDALLVNTTEYIILILEEIINLGIKVRFHTPNALHIRYIDKKISTLMYNAGFKTLRLGLETALFDNRKYLDAKVTEEDFLYAVSCLLKAGFAKKQIGAYLLIGIPGQKIESAFDSIEFVKNAGISPIPAYYSPIPNTLLWPEAKISSRYDLESDPIFTNNSILPCQKDKFSWKKIALIKSKVKI